MKENEIFIGNDRYVGQLKDGVPSGKGTLFLKDHDMFEKYEGYFENGELTGVVDGFPKKKDGNAIKYTFRINNGNPNLDVVTVKYKNGTFFIGKLSKEYYPIKEGTVYFSQEYNMKTFVGGVNTKGEPDGKGTVTFKNGDKYVGDYPKGKGTMTFKNGDVYVGDYPTGQGVLTFKNGDKYVGEYPKGKGTLKFANGDIYEGDYPTGKGTMTLKNGDIFEGNYPTDEGKLTFKKTGDVYVGDYPTGKGKLTFKNHEMYDSFEGSFKNGVPTDETGILKFKGTKTYYTGRYFKEPLKLKSGETTFEDGTKSKGSPVVQQNNKLMTSKDLENKLNFIQSVISKEEIKLEKIKNVSTEEAMSKIAEFKKHIEDYNFTKSKAGYNISIAPSLKDGVLEEADKIKMEVIKLVETTGNVSTLLDDTRDVVKKIKEAAKDRDVTKIEKDIEAAEKEKEIEKALNKAGDARKTADEIYKEVLKEGPKNEENKEKLKKIAWGVAGVAGVAGVSYYLYNKFKKSKKASTRKNSAAQSGSKKSQRSSGKK